MSKFIRDTCKPCEPVWKASFRDDKSVMLCECGNQTCMEIILPRPATEAMRGGPRRASFCSCMGLSSGNVFVWVPLSLCMCSKIRFTLPSFSRSQGG